MTQNSRHREKLIVLLLFGIIAFNYPVLTLFGKGSFLFGIPTLYFYLFVVWAIFIGLMAVALKRAGRAESPQQPPPSYRVGE